MNLFRTGLLLAAMTALFLVVGFLLGGRAGAVVALVIALGSNLFAFWGSDQMVLRMHNARPVTRASAPDLYALVADLAKRAGLPMPPRSLRWRPTWSRRDWRRRPCCRPTCRCGSRWSPCCFPMTACRG